MVQGVAYEDVCGLMCEMFGYLTRKTFGELMLGMSSALMCDLSDCNVAQVACATLYEDLH